MGLLITFILGVFLLAGAFFAQMGTNKKQIETLSVAIAFGAMVMLALTDILPESVESMDGRWYIVVILALLGVNLLKMLDHFVPDHDNDKSTHHNCSTGNSIHIGVVSTLAIVLHNIIEGMAVYSMAATDLRVGLMMALGVGLHNIPMGMMLSSTLRFEKQKKKDALLGAAGLSTFVGGVLMFFFYRNISETAVGILMSLTLGMILYLVIFELLPHILHAKDKKLSVIGVAIGVAILLASMLLE